MSPRKVKETRLGALLLAWAAWAFALAPLVWGVIQTLKKAAVLFQ
jgi:hypothetical protein